MPGYKKKYEPPTRQPWGVLWLLCTNLGDGILCTLSPNHNIHRINCVYQWWTTYTLKSKGVSEMHFPGIWRSKVTDFASKKTQSLGKNDCKQKRLDKSLPNTAMTWPTDSFYTRSRSDWIRNVVLKTLY